MWTDPLLLWMIIGALAVNLLCKSDDSDES